MIIISKFIGGVLLAYLNAVNVEVSINQTLHRMLGIGNVCVDKENAHAGVDSILMACINAFVKQSDTCGIPLCKETLIPFYGFSNWVLAEPDTVTIKQQPYTYYVMAYDPHSSLALRMKMGKINFCRGTSRDNRFGIILCL